MALLKALHLANDGSTPDIDRRFMGAISLDGSRVIGSGSLVVSEKSGTPNMSVDVSAGRAWVLGTDSSFQGSYYIESTAVENVVIAAADSTNARIDLIVATVRDDSYGAGSDDWILQAVQGTPAAVPVAPSVPDSSIVLAEVDVAANETAIEDAHVTDARYDVTYNAGGYFTKNGLVVASEANFPASPEAGDKVFSTTDNVEMVYNGTKWHPASGSKTVFASYTATASSAGGSMTAISPGVSVTVPSWATTVDVEMSVHGWFNGTTNAAITALRAVIGGQAGDEARIYPIANVANQRMGADFKTRITLSGSGSQTLLAQGQLISGSGTFVWDTNVKVQAMLTFRP